MHHVLVVITLLLDQGWPIGPPPAPPTPAPLDTASVLVDVAASAPVATPAPVVKQPTRVAQQPSAPAPVAAPTHAAEPAAPSVFVSPPLIDVPVFDAPILVAQAGGATALSAPQVVEKVQAFYLKTNRLTAEFRQYYTNVTFGKKTQSDGTVYIKKPGKMRWDYRAKSRGKVKQVKSFVSDGQRLWAVEHDNKQAFKQDLDGNVLPVAITFLHGTGNLNKDFTATLDKSGKRGRTGDLVLELVPKKPSAQYKTLWLVVDPSNFRVRESVVLEASGNTNRFAFYKPNVEKSINDTWFSIDERALKKNGYRIVEPEKKAKP